MMAGVLPLSAGAFQPAVRMVERKSEPAVEPCCEYGADRLGFDEQVGCGKAAALRARYLAGRPPVDEPGYVPPPGLREAADATDVLHNKIDIEIVPSAGTITGSNTFTIRSKVNGLSEFTFRLRNNFTVSGAMVNGATPVTVVSLSTTTMKATLDRAYYTGETFTLMIPYTGTAVSRGFGSIDFTT